MSALTNRGNKSCHLKILEPRRTKGKAYIIIRLPQRGMRAFHTQRKSCKGPSQRNASNGPVGTQC